MSSVPAQPGSGSPTITAVPKTYSVRAYHIAERLRLKEVRDRLGYDTSEFSNYEMIIPLSARDSYMFLYSFGSVVFFNATDLEVEHEMARLRIFRSPGEGERTSDAFLVEVSDNINNKVFFDRITINRLSFQSIKIVAMLLGQSTALEYYDILIENLLEQTGKYSRTLEKEGKFLEGSEGLIKFIGQCMNTKQEIISRLHIVDAPDEVWEDNELERIFLELKAMLEIDARYRALEYKIRIIQESIEIIVDLSKSRKSVQLEMIIIALIATEILLTLWTHFFVK
jgi:uncharacterized Rmd1/YagE family protein